MKEVALDVLPPPTPAPIFSSGKGVSADGVTSQARDWTLLTVLCGIALPLGAELLGVLAAAHGHFIYPLEAAYTDLALAKQIALGHYGLAPGEAAAPSSSILYPFLLAALQPLGLGAVLPFVVNSISTLAAGTFAVLLAREIRIPLNNIPPPRLLVLTAVVMLALDLPGLALTGLEHSFHVAMTVAYLLGLVRFVRRGRCDWWWFACIVIQPIVRFEAAGMLFADALIFVAFRKYYYASAIVAIGIVLVGGYSLFLHSLGLPLLPSSVLARSDWSNAAAVSHSGISTVVVALLKNLYSNLNSFGAAQMLGGVALGLVWLSGAWASLAKRPLEKSDQIKIATFAFMTFVTIAHIAGGKLGWKPARYEAYVLVLILCSLAVIYRDQISTWCEHVTWRKVSFVSVGLMLVQAGYAAQSVFILQLAAQEYRGPYQLHRFVTQFYQAPVAIDQIGYINFSNPYYVLDLSGLASEAARQLRAQARTPDWMDALMASHNVGVSIIDTSIETSLPATWTMLGALEAGDGLTDGPGHRFTIYARRPADAPAAADALDRFAATLPPGIHLSRR